jgi:hypothetical protein
MAGELNQLIMKSTIKHSSKHASCTARTAALDSANARASDAFFADETDPAREARKQALEVIARLLIWIAEAEDMQRRGFRATIALYCVRPDLIGGMTLEKIGGMAGTTKQAAHKLARDFRLGMGLVS